MPFAIKIVTLHNQNNKSRLIMDMQILEIAAVIILVVIGLFIYRNKKQQ